MIVASLVGGCSHARSNGSAPSPSQELDAATIPAVVEGAEDAGTPAPECASFHETDATFRLAESPPKRTYSVDGYVARRIRLERTIGQAPQAHCIVVAWPPGEQNTDGQEVHAAARIDDGWLRGIENTLERVPWPHVIVLDRIVIDNRPKEHGIAPFDQGKPEDSRDGHTIWLHERMFEDPNHWAHGNYGAYWSYHVDIDGQVLDDQPPTHALFSPVLLHELGHLVSYNVLNGLANDPTVPACAKTCADRGGCKDLPDEEREQGCISPYCTPFHFERTSTENWAEQYRFFYQGSRTRNLLAANGGCLKVLIAHDGKRGERTAPWERGLPDLKTFHRSLWDSCHGTACKAW